MRPVRPMLAKATPVSEALLHRRDMAWEPKWDGFRLVAECRGPDLPPLLWSRSGKVAVFPTIAEHLQRTEWTGVLDGEIVVMKDGRPSFNALQNAGRMTRQALEDRMRFVVFDVLDMGGVDQRNVPYRIRRDRLLDVVERRIVSPRIEPTPATDDGPGLWRAMELSQMEGMIGKPLDSLYREGSRSEWLKLKRKAQEEFVVIGWTWGEGGRANEIGALVLATVLPNGSLAYAGKVGTGFDGRSLGEVRQELEKGRRSDAVLTGGEQAKARRHIGPEPVVWVDPERIALIEYAEKSEDGIPRFPSFKGLR